MKRGNEKPDHIRGKLLLARVFRSLGFTVLFELLLADLVAVRIRANRCDIVCGEYDRTPRNFDRNVLRDLEGGARSVLTGAPNERVWEYNHFPPWKRDARELDPAFASKLDQVREEVKKTGRKAPRDYDDEIWRLMKQRHNVEWLTPLDLNPGVNIDF